MTPRLAAGGLAWAGAMTLAAVYADVEPWRAQVTLALAAVALAPGLPDLARALIAGGASVALLDATSELPATWVMLALASVSAVGEGWKVRLGAAAALGLAAIGVWQGEIIALVAPLGLAALSVLAAPAARWAGAAPLAFGALALGLASFVSWKAATDPLVDAAVLVERRAAWRLQPVLLARAQVAIEERDIAGAQAVLRVWPDDLATGLALAKAEGVGSVIEVGWDPKVAIEPEVAVAVAWGLVELGRGPEGERWLERQADPLSRVHLAVMRSERTGQPELPAPPYPEGFPVAPGVLVALPTVTAPDGAPFLFVAPTGIADLLVSGEVMERGGVELTLRAREELLGTSVLEGHQRVSLPVDLPAGAWRLGWALDAAGAASQDPEVLDFTIEAR